jgi:CSLREA domain-containing protein
MKYLPVFFRSSLSDLKSSRPVSSLLTRFYSQTSTFITFSFIVLSVVAFAHAATLTVNSTADPGNGVCNPGECTLREAIAESNSTPGVVDTIQFSLPAGSSIALTQGQLLITRSVNISGPGARNLFISGNANSRVFQIEPIIDILDPLRNVTISGVTITGGNGAANTIAGVPLLPGPGGGILNDGGATLNLVEVNLSGNNIPIYGAVSSNLLVGGGIATLGSDTFHTVTNMTRCLIANNSAVGGGGGVSNAGTGIVLLGATTTITNSTITNNITAATGGGALNVAGELNLTNVTISDNTSVVAGGGVVSLIGTLPSILGVTNLRNTIIARNNAQILGGVLNLSDDVLGVLGSFNSLGHNLIGHNLNATLSFQASVFIGTTPQPNAQLDLVGSIGLGVMVIDPKLGSITNNGGPTNTRAILTGSPALDAADNCVTNAGSNPCGSSNTPPVQLATDQRSTGFTRLVGTAVDIGAYEAQGTPTDLVLTVNILSDHAPDGCTAGDCTLREAILETNATPSADTIRFAPALAGGTVVLASGSGFGELLITDSVSIFGPNGCARNFTISGNNTSRIFHINPLVLGQDIVVNIGGVTMRDGNGAANTVLGLPVTPGPGGGILNDGGATLNLTDVNLSFNATTLLGLVPANVLVGGGIATIGTDTSRTKTFITRSLISNNSALGGGGGLSNTGTGLDVLGSTTTITNSTITSNGAGTLLNAAAGGGILNTAGTMFITSSTVSHNRALLLGGGIVNVVGISPVGVVTTRNSIYAHNTDLLGTDLLFPDTAGIFNSQGNNLVENNGLLGITVGLTANVTLLGGIPLGATVDIVGSVQVGFVKVDPLLGSLQNNGGCTDTRAPVFGSPAIERGNDCVALGTCSTSNPNEPVLTSDQRRLPFVRRFDADNDGMPTIDIGAVEFQLAPTAAAVTVSGRVVDSGGRPISNAVIEITDDTGSVRRTTSGSLGFFSFDGIVAGEAYFIEVSHGRYRFTPRVVVVFDEVTGLEFIADSGGMKNASEKR